MIGQFVPWYVGVALIFFIFDYMDEYDLQTQFVLELLDNHFGITTLDLKKKEILPFVINSDNHEILKLSIIGISRRNFNSSKHKKNYAIKSILNLYLKH